MAGAIVLVLAGYIGFFLYLYWLMQPTISAAKPELIGYRPPPKTVVRLADSPSVLPAQPEEVKLSNDLDAALDKLIKRKVEDFEWNIGGKDMTATTNNTVNIINSEISNAVVEINQSGRDTISKETAKKLGQLVNSKEIKELPEPTRLDVLDQVSDLIKKLKGPTDAGKVHRGLKRLAGFISSVASKAVADTVTQLGLHPVPKTPS